MNIRYIAAAIGLAAFFATGPVHAFMPNPDLLTVSPCVAKAGTTVEVSISGKDLEEAKTLRFNQPGIQVEQVMLPADEFHPAPRPVEGKFKVTIPADFEPAVYEVRSRGYFGLSTARPFLVLPAGAVEAVETGTNVSTDTAMNLPLNSGVLGTLAGGQYDWFRFDAKKGQRLLFEIRAERLDSKADVILAVSDVSGAELESSRHHFGRDPFVDFTVPADGAYFVSVSDTLYGGGREYFYHLHIGDRPHIDFVFPPAGVPGQKQSFTFFGRNLPEGSPGGGWKLDGKALETVDRQLDVPAEVGVPAVFHPGTPRQGMLPGFETGLPGSNPVRIGFATAPVRAEDPAAEEQVIEAPVEIAGRFDEPGDYDVFRLNGKKGTPYWVDVVSHRLGAVTDPVVKVEKIVRDKDGKETFQPVAENDDLPSFFGPDGLDDLNADSYDPALTFTPEEDGEFRISLFNQSAGGSLAHLYRLAVRQARHDYRLLAGTELTKTINNDAFPAAPLVRPGGSMIYRIIALREDGYAGDITVTAEGLPPGVTAKPLVLSGDTSQGFLTIWAAPDTAAWTGPIRLVGRAKVGETETVREARPASILWGQRVFAFSSQVRSRLDCELVLSVIDSPTEAEPTRLSPVEEKTWTVELGGTLEIPLKTVENGNRVGNLQVNVHGFPGLHRSPPTASVAEKATEVVLKFPFVANANFDAKPGTYQFVLQGIGNARYEQNPEAAKRAEAEVARLKKLADAQPARIDEAKKALAAAEQQLAAAEKKEAGAADDAARAVLKGDTAAARAGVDTAKKELQSREAALETLKKLQDTAGKEAQKAAATAKQKTNQFATYSQPITVVVTEKKK